MKIRARMIGGASSFYPISSQARDGGMARIDVERRGDAPKASCCGCSNQGAILWARIEMKRRRQPEWDSSARK